MPERHSVNPVARGQGLYRGQHSARTWLKGDDVAHINRQLGEPELKIRMCGISTTTTDNRHITPGVQGPPDSAHTLSLAAGPGAGTVAFHGNESPRRPRSAGAFSLPLAT